MDLEIKLFFESFKNYSKKSKKNSYLVVLEGADHNDMEEYSTKFIDEINQFLSQLKISQNELIS